MKQMLCLHRAVIGPNKSDQLWWDWTSRARIIKATRFDVVVFILFIDPDYLFLYFWNTNSFLVLYFFQLWCIDLIHTNRKDWTGTLSLKQHIWLFEYAVIDDNNQTRIS